MRQDKGALGKNFLISARLKNNQDQGRMPGTYFRGTHDQAEIDWLFPPMAHCPATFQGSCVKLTASTSKSPWEYPCQEPAWMPRYSVPVAVAVYTPPVAT